MKASTAGAPRLAEQSVSPQATQHHKVLVFFVTLRGWPASAFGLTRRAAISHSGVRMQSTIIMAGHPQSESG